MNAFAPTGSTFLSTATWWTPTHTSRSPGDCGFERLIRQSDLCGDLTLMLGPVNGNYRIKLMKAHHIITAALHDDPVLIDVVVDRKSA